MRKTRVNTGFHEHAESVGRLRRLRKSRYSLNNPETWARFAHGELITRPGTS